MRELFITKIIFVLYVDMTLAKDLIEGNYYIPPGYSKPCKLIGIAPFPDQDEYSSPSSSCSNDLFLIFKDPDSKKIFTKTVDRNKHLYSECCGCVVSGGKKTRRKMKKRKPRKSRKARKSARG